MEDKMLKIRKKIKVDTYAIYLISAILIGLSVMSVMNIVRYSLKAPEAFEVRMVEDKDFGKECVLYIDDEESYPVDYNEYSKVDRNGNENPKMCFIIDEISSAMRFILMTFLFGLSSEIFMEIIKGGKPFIYKNAKRLQMMAVIIMLVALVPGFIRLAVTFFVFTSAYGQISGNNLLILLLGALLGIISEIFKYGCELQDDMDQIA